MRKRAATSVPRAPGAGRVWTSTVSPSAASGSGSRPSGATSSGGRLMVNACQRSRVSRWVPLPSWRVVSRRTAITPAPAPATTTVRRSTGCMAFAISGREALEFGLQALLDGLESFLATRTRTSGGSGRA